MKRSEHMKRLRARLIKRHDELLDLHKDAEAHRRTLSEPEIEPEETAQKETLGDFLAELDSREKNEIDAIDHALSMMETGRYGFCEVCGKLITLKRLEAIPWTVLCGKHAQ